MEQPAWKHNVVFPMIGRVIREACDDQGGYISAHRIAFRLTQDREAQVVIEEAQRQLGDTQSHGGIATNMVAWFSARMTGGQSEWDRVFERVLVDGEWAYRPQERKEAESDRSSVELQTVIAEFPKALDDRSAEFVAILRDSGVLGDEDWARIIDELRRSLRFLAGPNRTVSKDAQGSLVLHADADPRNADWLRSVAANRLAGHHLPVWSSFWLWRLGHDRGTTFWSRIRAAADRFGCEALPPATTSARRLTVCSD